MHNLKPAPSETRLTVSAPDGEYIVVLGHALLERLGELAGKEGLGRKVVVATDTNVAPLYADVVLSSLANAGFEPSLALMQAGEAHKNSDSVNVFINHFLSAGVDRSGWIIALGGGVVGDTAGFAAAIYMRGLPLVQVPTTLLAMADSSIGGKVGVDHPNGKNLLGLFKQPRLVIADLDTLATLPAEQLACGMAEIIKAGIIDDPPLFALIEECDLSSLDYRRALYNAILVKRRIVEQDPYEKGVRAYLNLGHTFGHAFEKCTWYNRLHGLAVAQGTVVAFRLAEKLGLCHMAERARLEHMLERWALPTRWGAPDLAYPEAIEQVWSAMSTDKKRQDGQLRFVLPEVIGKVRIVNDIPEATVKSVLAELQ
ncbi:MAG: 3-dehydroquinate synthase [Chloroflexi bacterium]|nr:3-dehydroquinate synthase [Chloroflexota bacterium]